VRTVHSDYGHDGFLIEEDQVGQHVTAFLRDSVRAL
jgi:homoserine O-acetyltransferase/O-succinyltransferase